MSTREPTVLVHGEPIAQRQARALIGWVSREEAIQLLLGRNPAPGEDLTRIEGQFDAMRAAVGKRSKLTPKRSVVDSPKLHLDLESLAQNPLLNSVFAPFSWTLKIVDLRMVIAYQKAISIDGLDERVKPVVDDPSRLAEFCLPGEQPVPPQGVLGDVDQKGYTVSSLNPNLRIAGTQVQQVQFTPKEGMQPVPMLAITFLVSMGHSYLQVAHYNGRDFLRDGYHRAAALLHAGINEVPCVYLESKTFEEVGANPATMFSYEVLYGDRPPLLGDFWDDSVSADIEQPTIRKAVRLRGEEFSIQG